MNNNSLKEDRKMMEMFRQKRSQLRK